MRSYKTYLMLIILVAATCFYSAQGQYGMSSASISSASISSSSIPSAGMPSISASGSHISAPVQTLVLGKIPNTIYLGAQQQSAHSSQYPTNAGGAVPALWIQGDGGWIQYATIPQGSAVTLIAGSTTGGNGYLSEVLNGTEYNYSFYFYPHSQLTFYSNAIGQHVLSYSLSGRSSNQVIIDVIPYVPPQYYRAPYGYRAPYAPYDYLTSGYYLKSYYYSVPYYSSYKYGKYGPRFYDGYYWHGSNYPWLDAP